MEHAWVRLGVMMMGDDIPKAQGIGGVGEVSKYNFSHLNSCARPCCAFPLLAISVVLLLHGICQRRWSRIEEQEHNAGVDMQCTHPMHTRNQSKPPTPKALHDTSCSLLGPRARLLSTQHSTTHSVSESPRYSSTARVHGAWPPSLIFSETWCARLQPADSVTHAG